ncbi:MAG TPA: cobalt-precorrin-5B (C(1))-methyltransferase [Candidatus Binataceae bacterium]|nr:cobalt-precorrin-5B (C(1))-methyltransferase [Candidatus Binataceae bacterium]
MSTRGQVPQRNPKGRRTGFTTGACSAAAAKAAARCLVTETMLAEIETTLPNQANVTFALARCEIRGQGAVCSVIKDAGDDPDCTHGAELIAEVELKRAPGVTIVGGLGVAKVTKSGLGLEVGAPAVNPIPRRNITEMIEAELATNMYRGAVVTISVPRGEEMAKETINARLGLIGGISILGTTGIVRPYSTAAFKASVIQAIDVARARGVNQVVLTTGGKSESYAMQLLGDLPEEAFIQMGDFVGIAVKHCARRKLEIATIVGMIGKLSKMADGKMQTHAAGSEVNMTLLARLADEVGAPAAVCEQILSANTARHVLEICQATGVTGLTAMICRRVAEHVERHAGGSLQVNAFLIDFNGTPLGHYPPEASLMIARQQQ